MYSHCSVIHKKNVAKKKKPQSVYILLSVEKIYDEDLFMVQSCISVSYLFFFLFFFNQTRLQQVCYTIQVLKH